MVGAVIGALSTVVTVLSTTTSCSGGAVAIIVVGSLVATKGEG